MAPESTVRMPNIAVDAQRTLEVMLAGGVAIMPLNVGYGICATSTEALDKAFRTKRRKAHKRHAMLGSAELQRELHVLPEREAGMVKLLTEDLEFPLGTIAPYKADHPIIQSMSSEMLAKCSMDGTLSMLMNSGAFSQELVRLAASRNIPVFGSSANLTGKGTKVMVADIEPEIMAVADIVIDYGRQKFDHPRPSSTMLRFTPGHVDLIRFGACYPAIQDAMLRFVGIALPDDPGRDVLFSGHTGELQDTY